MRVSAGLYMYDVVVKSSRSLSHLLMSSCFHSCGNVHSLLIDFLSSSRPNCASLISSRCKEAREDNTFAVAGVFSVLVYVMLYIHTKCKLSKTVIVSLRAGAVTTDQR